MVVSNALRGATLSGDPLTWRFQALCFLHFLTLPLLVAMVVLLLVLAPSREAYASMRVGPPKLLHLSGQLCLLVLLHRAVAG